LYLAPLALLSSALGWHDSAMNEVIRYRLIGSVFLLALAGIFVPMMFDAPSRENTMPGSVTQDGLTSGSGDATQTGPAMDLTNDTDTIIAELQQQQSQIDEVFATTQFRERVDALNGEVDADGYWVENGTRFGEPILTPVRSNTEVFAVQLATFDRLENAQKLRAKLRDAGQEAFLSQYKQRGLSGEKIRYRVAVGPLLSHTQAKEKRMAYTETYNVQAIVVAMTQ